MRISKLAKDTIIILIISLILIVLPEIILRIICPEKVRDFQITFPPAFKFNKDYGYILKPNIQKSFQRSDQNGGNIIKWHTNKNSFRGAELEDNPNKRIIVYGDSNILAEFSILENTFTAQLGKYLNSYDLADIEVVNAGICGFGPDQNLIRFKNEANLYHPNLVIFHIFADNDFGDIFRNRIFELDKSGELIKSNYKFTIDEFNSRRKRLIKKVIVSNSLTLRAILKLFGLFQKEREVIQTELNQEESRLVDIYQKYTEKEYSVYKKSMPKIESMDHYDIDIALNPEQESSIMKIKLMEEVLKKANDFARSKNIAFLVLIQPSVIDSTKENFSLNYEHLQKYPNYKRTNLTNAIEKICVSHNIKYINLFEVFKNSSPEQLFFRGVNNHWNDLGQDIAARETASLIYKLAMLND
jgi:hypothetical protein